MLGERLTAAASIVAALAVVRFTIRDAFCLYDDAFITMRYVKNVFAGCGLRFNCDDAPVEGFTSPLHLAILTIGRIFSANLPLVATIVSSFFLAAALVVTAWTARTPLLFGDRPLVAGVVAMGTALALGLDPMLLLNAVTGLETTLAAAFVALLFASAVSANQRGLRTLLVLATLARPECALFALALPVFPRARSLRYGLPLIAAFGAIALVRFALFHDLVPNTFHAKSGGTWRHAELGLAYIGVVFDEHPIVALCPLALLIPRARAAVIFVIAPSVAWLASFLYTGGDTFPHARFAVPLVPTLTLLAVCGVVAVVEEVRAGGENATGRREGAKAGGGMDWGAGAALAVAIVIGARAAIVHPVPEGHGFDNVTRWTKLGLYLKAHHPGARIATVPIGAIGYYSELHVLDLVGLTAPPIARAGRSVPLEMLHQNWLGHERHDLEWTLAQKPDVLVFTQWRDRPFMGPLDAVAGFYAEWLLLRAIKEGRAPYEVEDAPIDGLHALLFVREEG